MSQFFIDFVNALDTQRPVQKAVREIAQVQLGIKNEARSKAAEVEKSPNWEHLNDFGKRAARRAEVAHLVKSNAQARLSLKKLRAEMKLPKLPGREKDDVAGVLQDQEFRMFVRGLPQEQRDRVQRLHPDIAAAVARAPAELSGISQSVHDQLVSNILQDTHGVELAKIGADMDAIKWAEELAREADKEVRAAAEVQHGADFRAWAKPLLDPILTGSGTDFEALYARIPSVNLFEALAAAG